MDWDAATGVGGVAPVGREHKPNGQNPVGPLRASWRSSAVGGIQAWARSSGRRASSQPTLLLLHRGRLATTWPETRSGHHGGLQADVVSSLPRAGHEGAHAVAALPSAAARLE